MADNAVPAGRSGKGPVFIVGPMGSGTTLLRLIVDSHDNIAIAQETSIMRAYLAHKWIPFHRHGGDWYGRLGWSADELDERMREFYGGMFERFAAGQGKPRWGDKTPWHAWHIREISRLFPDAVVLATVRHPGAVTASVSGRFRLSWKGAVSHWVNTTTELVQRGQEMGERFLLVRYEDLVLEPETTLREVFAWLDEPWSDRLLEHDKVHSERGTPRKVEGASRSDEPIDPSRISTWAEKASAEELAALRAGVGRLPAFYGYHMDDVSALDPMTAEGSPRARTLTGTDLAARRAQFPDYVELDKEMTPWFGNRMLTPDAAGIISPQKAAAPKGAAKKKAAASPATAGVADRARVLGGKVARRALAQARRAQAATAARAGRTRSGRSG